jgi:acyl-CoA synthetase (NDP forming)
MSENPLKRILHPRSIAVFGASEKITTMGTYQLINIFQGGFPGRVYPVHPNRDTVQGLKAYARAQDLPEAPDLALITVPTRAVPGVMRDLGRRGIKRAIIISGGFKEMGEDGRRLESEVVEIARGFGIRFLGPNCIGVINPYLPLNTTMYYYFQRPGHMAMASHSGTYVTQVLPYLQRRGIGYSRGISLGNEADIDIVTALEYLAEDEDTRAIALYLEVIRRGSEFIRTARRVSRIKPVVAVYVGGTEAGSRSGASHTGAMAGSDEIYNGAFAQTGILRAQDVQSLYNWAFCLSEQPGPTGPRMAIITHSGGPATSLADACNRHGLDVPEFSPGLKKRVEKFMPATGSSRNPVDVTFGVDMKALFLDIPEAILDSGEVDGLILHGVGGGQYFQDMGRLAKGAVQFPPAERMEKFMSYVTQGLHRICQEAKKPVVCSAFSDRTEDPVVAELQDLGIPCFDTPEQAVSAMAALRRIGRD